MLFEGAVLGITAYAMYRILDKNGIKNRKIKKEIKNKWSILMDSIGTNSENKIEQQYEILEIFPKHYGFDMIVSLPLGKKFQDILSLLPAIQSCFQAEAIAKLADKKNTSYIRVHQLDKEISDKDRLRFNWFKVFNNIDGCLTKAGETVEIDKVHTLTSPTDDIVGYTVYSKIPIGISYEKVKGAYNVISKSLGKCYFNFNTKTMQLETNIITQPIDNDTKFKPISVKPWELYFAMGYDWKPVIFNYSETANALIGGNQGTGKTNALIGAFINLCHSCKGETYDDSFDLMVCNVGEKEDLRVFRDVKQCKGYANSIGELKSMLLYLIQEMKRRNQLFAERKKFIFNIHQYNKLIREEKGEMLKVIHFVADEIADLAENDEIQKLLWDLIRKSRSAGIYITVATQRGSVKNLDSEIKGQLANQISFSQPNTASALTIMSGEDVAKKVMDLEKTRECLVDYAEGLKVAKTLFLSPEMMQELLEDVILTEEDSKNNKLILDGAGNIIKKPQETSSDIETHQKTLNNTKNSSKTVKNTKEPRWKLKNKKKGD